MPTTDHGLAVELVDTPSAAVPASPVPEDRKTALRMLATDLRDRYDLRGRWGWFGWHKRDLHLQTQGNGGMYVISFDRLGMSQAQPVFPHRPDGRDFPSMTKAMAMARFQVCHEADSPDDPRVYRGTIDGIKNPVAEYLAAVDAETILALLDELDALRAELAAARVTR